MTGKRERGKGKRTRVQRAGCSGSKELGAGSGTSLGSLGSDVGTPTSDLTLAWLAPVPAPRSPVHTASLPLCPSAAGWGWGWKR